MSKADAPDLAAASAEKPPAKKPRLDLQNLLQQTGLGSLATEATKAANAVPTRTDPQQAAPRASSPQPSLSESFEDLPELNSEDGDEPDCKTSDLFEPADIPEGDEDKQLGWSAVYRATNYRSTSYPTSVVSIMRLPQLNTAIHVS